MKSLHIITLLQKANLLEKTDIECRELTGGVSSEILLISDGVNNLVVKQARKKLMVEDEWLADTDRNRVEREFAQFAEEIIPDAVPKIRYIDEKHDFFVMDYLDVSYDNWKDRLMGGVFDVNTAANAANLLADLHLKTAGNKKAMEKFSSNEFFKSLRTEPYLITTGNRHPALKKIFYDEANRLENHREALVHGDFSPKNIMIGPEHVVLLDHEVAHFGDPVFDIAFLLNHLYLKRLYNFKKHDDLPDLSQVVWMQYTDIIGSDKAAQLELRTGKLLLLLMLARVDGKSPVEYLDEHQKDFVRDFVYAEVGKERYHLNDINRNWTDKLNNEFLED